MECGIAATKALNCLVKKEGKVSLLLAGLRTPHSRHQPCVVAIAELAKGFWPHKLEARRQQYKRGWQQQQYCLAPSALPFVSHSHSRLQPFVCPFLPPPLITPHRTKLPYPAGRGQITPTTNFSLHTTNVLVIPPLLTLPIYSWCYCLFSFSIPT